MENRKTNGNKGLNYIYPSLFFVKKWFWFKDPEDVENVDMAIFFSYNQVKKDNFKRKKGLTTIIDLKKNKEELWMNMRKSFIRKQIKRGEKNNILVKKSNNFEEFKKIYRIFRINKNLVVDNFKVMKEKGVLFSAYFDGRMIAGGIFAPHKPFVRAWSLSSLRFNKSGKLREIIGQANRMIIWEAIKYFKKENFEIFDLGGINLSSKEKNKSSLAKFKEAFGGQRCECYYYIRVYSRFLKFCIKLKNML